MIVALLLLSACKSLPKQYDVPSGSSSASLINPLHKLQRGPRAFESKPTTLKPLLLKLGVVLSDDEFNYLKRLVVYEQNKLEKNGFVDRAIVRGERYIPYIKTELKASGLPTEFVYLAMIESGFKSSAKSHKGATGVWQLMPRTSKGLGLAASQRHDVYLATKAAIKYLKSRYAVFGNKALLVAASYNVGEGGVSARLRKLNNPFERSFIAIHPRLPKETKDYVPRWLAATLIANDLARRSRYDLPTTTVITKEAYKISHLAKALGLTQAQFYRLNPSYKNKRYLYHYHNFIVLDKTISKANIKGFLLLSQNNYKIERLTENRRLAKLDKKKPASRKTKQSKAKQKKGFRRTRYVEVKISKGLTYSHLHQWFGLTKAQLKKHNRYLKRGLIAGGKIKIPTSQLRIKHYKVRRGDTLGGIAKRYKMSLKQLKLTNGIKKSRIYPGQKLRLWLPA